MNNTLLLFDLDGTLLRPDGTVSPGTREALGRCKALGARIGYITSRAARQLGTLLKGLPCDALATYNGAIIHAGGQELARSEIPHTRGMALVRALRSARPGLAVEAYLEPFSYKQGRCLDLRTGALYPCDLDALPSAPIQRIRIPPQEGLGPSIFSGMDVGDLCILQTLIGSMLITHRTATKENAMAAIAKHLGISESGVIVFGDDLPDLGMIRAAGLGIAMGNAIPAVKAVADAVAGTNDRDGAARWLEQHLLGDERT